MSVFIKGTSNLSGKRAMTRGNFAAGKKSAHFYKIDVDFNFIELYKTKEQFNFIK